MLNDMAFMYQPIYGLVQFIIIIQRKKTCKISTLYDRLFSLSVFLMNLLAILYVCSNYVKVINIFHNHCYLHTVAVYAITEHNVKAQLYTVLNIIHLFILVYHAFGRSMIIQLLLLNIGLSPNCFENVTVVYHRKAINYIHKKIQCTCKT